MNNDVNDSWLFFLYHSINSFKTIQLKKLNSQLKKLNSQLKKLNSQLKKLNQLIKKDKWSIKKLHKLI